MSKLKTEPKLSRCEDSQAKTKQKKRNRCRSAHQFPILHVHVRVAVATLQHTQYALISTFSAFSTSDINYKKSKALIKNPK
jgi:hypothetical protein